MKITFICNMESWKMRYASKGLGLSCLLVAVVSGFGLAEPTARAQQPSRDDTAADAPSPDTGTGTDADTDTDIDTDTDTDTDIGTDTDGPEIVLPPGEVAPEEPGGGSYRVEIDPLRGM